MWQSTPVFIINRNNLDRGFRRQVEWLRRAGMENVTVVDNGSNYQPLLDYYASSGINVAYQGKNGGPWVFWQTEMHKSVNSPYIVSDADVFPVDTCPSDLVERLLFVQENHPGVVQKVGPGIRIDNIPDCYNKKKQVIAHETQYSLEEHRCIYGVHPWVKEGCPKMFQALIDTTFALYHPQAEFPGWYHHYRLDAPYVVEHFPWYEDAFDPTPEYTFYKNNTDRSWSTWEGRDEDTGYRESRDSGQGAG